MKFLAWCFAFIFLAAILSHCNNTQTTTPAIVKYTEPQSPSDPHERRLFNLHKKREGLESSFEMEVLHGKEITREAMELSTTPPWQYEPSWYMPGWTYANERQYLMDSMDKEELKLHKLKGEIDAVDAEIAREEQQGSTPNTPAEVPPPTDTQPESQQTAVQTTAPQPDQEPSIVSRVEPEYSEQARRAKWQGDIDVTLDIDENGKVTSVSVLNSPGMGLSAKVIVAVSQWRLKPKIKDGVPVPCTVNARVTFRLL